MNYTISASTTNLLANAEQFIVQTNTEQLVGGENMDDEDPVLRDELARKLKLLDVQISRFKKVAGYLLDVRRRGSGRKSVT